MFKFRKNKALTLFKHEMSEVQKKLLMNSNSINTTRALNAVQNKHVSKIKTYRELVLDHARIDL